MDLTRLYNLTTPELRDEAERLGVNDTYAMSRGQLIHAIRNRVAGPPSEGLLGKVLGIAKWALQPRKDTPSPSPAPPLEEEPKHFGRPSETPMPPISGESGSVPAAAPASGQHLNSLYVYPISFKIAKQANFRKGFVLNCSYHQLLYAGFQHYPWQHFARFTLKGLLIQFFCSN